MKKRAKQKGLPFTLTLEDIPETPEKCPILGILLRPNDKVGPLDCSPSLDRLSPDLGYVPRNVRIISNRANRLRGDATAKELRLLADDLEIVENGQGLSEGCAPIARDEDEELDFFEALEQAQRDVS